MKLLRNPEVGRSLFLYVIVTIIASVAAGIREPEFGLFTAVLGIVFIVIYLVTTRKHYTKLAGLAEDIDKILHGDSYISFDRYTEGEIGILQSEISKMTVRLREQQQRLLDDKIYLADSIADISHQIRTPLTSINLIVEFLSEPGLTEERRIKLIRELHELLTRIDWLITALLKISKLDAGTVQFKTEKLQVKELIDKACAPLLVPIELRGQELIIKATGEFSGDVSWTCEALGNVIINCMEHTPAGGRLTVNASENPLYTEITVEDTGSGIDKEDLPHIFERFYKGKDSGDKSFGIGLALARMIITNQNGTIKAENGQEVGAKFTVRFYKGAV